MAEMSEGNVIWNPQSIMEMGGGWCMEQNFQLLIYERGVLWNQTANDGNGSVGGAGLFGTTWSLTEMGEGR